MKITKNEKIILYLSNTGWLFAERFLRIFSGIFVGIWVARYLGPESFGAYSFALALIALFGGIAKLGLDAIVVREIVNKKYEVSSLIGSAFWLKVCASFASIIALNFYLFFVNVNSFTQLFIALASISLIFSAADVVEMKFQALVKSKYVSISKIGQLTISAIIKSFLIIFEADLIWFAISICIDAFILTISYFIIQRITESTRFYKYFQIKIAKELIRNSWPLILTSISVLLFNQTDKVMIKAMLGDYEVGIYAAGAKIPESLSFVPMLLATSLFPAILQSRMKSDNSYQANLFKFYCLMTWLGIAAVCFVWVFADSLIGLYGAEFDGAKTVLLCNSLGLVFTFQWIARGRWVISENLQFISFYYMAFGAALNIVGNFYLISVFGMIGASMSTVGTQICITLLLPLFFGKFRRQTVLLLRSFILWR